ncbi:hypothetical protein SFRURICE_007446 [Spodoptera frugiperda]|nr:hypothetical protein SFRURICE_007446 [Spodoptera frugiperda]
MDDIVDYFEEFIKKSLVVISVALGTLILMIMYVFKMLAARPNGPRTLCNADPELNRSKEPKSVNSCISETERSCSVCSNPEKSSSVCSTTNKSCSVCSNPKKSTSACSNPANCQVMDSSTSNTLLTAKTASISAQVTSHPKFDKKTLREVGLSGCTKVCRSRSRTMGNSNSDCRSGPKTIEITKTPSEQMCRAKNHLANSRPCNKYIGIRTSCCSMCCVDDDRR